MQLLAYIAPDEQGSNISSFTFRIEDETYKRSFNFDTDTLAWWSRSLQIDDYDHLESKFTEWNSLRLFDVSHELQTQDNLGTHLPIFAVRQRVRIYGIDPGYSEDYVWMENDEWEEVDEETAAKCEAYLESEFEEPKGYTRIGFIDRDEFVTSCFTRKGCEDYIAANGHNLTDPHIFVYSGYRNKEWERIVNHLFALKA